MYSNLSNYVPVIDFISKTVSLSMSKYTFFIAVFFYSVFASAQLNVRDEPRHHNVFENEFIRVLDVHLGPKDTTLYHLHNTPSVFITLANVKVGSQLAGQQPQKGANLSGLIMYDDLATPRVHRVWNEDTSWFHVIDIELIARQPRNEVSLLNRGELKLNADEMELMFNEKLVTGYKLRISKAQTIKLPPSKSGYLFVSIDNALVDIKIKESIQHRNMKPGHYAWLEGKDPTTISSNSIAEFVILQLK